MEQFSCAVGEQKRQQQQHSNISNEKFSVWKEKELSDILLCYYVSYVSICFALSFCSVCRVHKNSYILSSWIFSRLLSLSFISPAEFVVLYETQKYFVHVSNWSRKLCVIQLFKNCDKLFHESSLISMLIFYAIKKLMMDFYWKGW